LSSSEDRVQSVRNAWINSLRAEVLRVGRAIPEVARVVSVGMWIATYADADGSNAFPARDTLATLTGCSQETVTRAVRVLMGVGVLARKRRPNASAVYQLLMPLGGGLDWAAHIHHMTDTRQRAARQREKAAATRTASADAPTSTTPTYGRDPLPDHDMAGLEPQPQVRAREAAKDESSTGESPAAAARAALAAVRERPPLARCTEPDCDMPLPPGVTGRCEGCRQYLAITDPERHSA
jgi:hypothetical protein